MGRIDENVTAVGAWNFLVMPTFPSGIANAQVASNAGIVATKLQHQYQKTYSQPVSTATTETRILHVVFGATGTIVAFRAGSVTLNVGAATVTFDLKRSTAGGAFASILTGVITLDTGNSAIVVEEGSISSASLVAGDVLEVVITATAGGGTLATGAFCDLVLREDAA